MLTKTSFHDVPTTANGRAGTIRIFVIEPNVPEYPNAKFPGCELDCRFFLLAFRRCLLPFPSPSAFSHKSHPF
jgi:hypothetical protein